MRAHLPAFFLANRANPSLASDLVLLAQENRAEREAEPHSECPPFKYALFQNSPQRRSTAHALTYVQWLMDRDRKSPALKSLQGRIWKAGFESGELKGALFDDVPPALERRNHHGAVANYSCGFVAAQQLPLRYPMFGNLTPRAAAHFDTRSAPKTEAASYAAIASNSRLAPREVCFIPDEVRELDPARKAGMETRLVMRPGNVGVSDSNGHVVIESFAAVG